MRLIKLAPSQRVEGRWLVQLESGELLRVGENEVVSFALYSGKELSEEEVDALRAAGRASAVKEKALSLLSARPMSRKELIDKLTARPRNREKEPLTDQAGAEAVADRLEELGYLNDGAYASMVVRHYSAKGYGRRRLQEELYRHGVPRDYWEEALAEALDFAKKRVEESGKAYGDSILKAQYAVSEDTPLLANYEAAALYEQWAQAPDQPHNAADAFAVSEDCVLEITLTTVDNSTYVVALSYKRPVEKSIP